MSLETTVHIICAVSIAVSAVVIALVAICMGCRMLADWLREQAIPATRNYVSGVHSEYRRRRFLKYMAKKRG